MHTMNNNDPRKSISYIASEMRVTEFFYDIGSVERHFEFFIQNEKMFIFISGNEEQEKRPCRKAFEQTQANLQQNML